MKVRLVNFAFVAMLGAMNAAQAQAAAGNTRRAMRVTRILAGLR